VQCDRRGARRKVARASDGTRRPIWQVVRGDRSGRSYEATDLDPQLTGGSRRRTLAPAVV